jgi:hypothetical protein
MRALKLMFVIALAVSFVSCGSGKEKKSTEKKSAEAEVWTSLFDGTSTDGWRGYNKTTFPEQGWEIVDGTLHCIGSGKGEAGGKGGDIIYDKKFSNFDLKLEWKISEGGNSGIIYLVQEDPKWAEPWKTGPEMQILDNERHPDAQAGKNGNRQAGALYDLIPAVPQNAKPAGEWNTAEIKVYKGSVWHIQNGETVLEYHLWTPDFNALIQDSKWPGENPDWANIASEGYIALQDHGDDVWFRNIQIREL